MVVARVLSCCLMLALVGCRGLAHDETLRPLADLDAALRSADELRLRTGGLPPWTQPPARTLFETRDPAEVTRVAALIRVDPRQRPGGACTLAWEVLEFRRAGRPVASLGLIGVEGTLRWGEDTGWYSDLILTRSSARALDAWLRPRGASLFEHLRVHGGP